MTSPPERSKDGHRDFPLWLKIAVFSLAYLLAAWVARFVSPTNGVYISFWLPAGLYLAVLMLAPVREWKWYILAALPPNLLFDGLQGTPFGAICCFWLINTLESTLGAGLFKRFVSSSPSVKTLPEYWGIILFGGILAPCVGGLFGALTLLGFGFSHSLWVAWGAWILGKAMAIVLVTPAILSLKGVPSTSAASGLRLLRWAEAAAIVFGLTLGDYYILVRDGGIDAPYKTRLILFVLWAAIRFGVRGASAATLWLSLVTAYFTVRYQVGLSPVEIQSESYVLTMQTFLALTSLFCLVPAIAIAERDRNLSELQASEDRFRALTLAASEGVVVSQNGRIIDLNDQLLVLFKCSRDRAVGRELIDFVAPEARAHVLDQLHRAVSAPYESLCLRDDGTTFAAEVQAKVIQVGDTPLRMTTIRDIDARKESERQLLQLADIVLSSDDAIVGKDLDGTITTWNPGAEAIFGFTASEAVGTRLVALYPPDRANEEMEILQAIARGERIRHFETTRKRKDGKLVHISATISPIVDSEGRVIGASKIARDITIARQAQQDLELFRTLVDGANDGFEILDPETGKILDVNEGSLRSLGYQRDEIVGAHLSLIRPDSDSAAEDFSQKIHELRDGEVVRIGSVRRRKDGSTFPVEIALRLVTLNRDYLVCVVRDMTDQHLKETRRIELEALLRRAQKMETVGRFAAGIAHDFNNILGAIFGCASLLAEDTVGNPEAQESTAEIVKAATRAKDLVQQILTFSNLQDPRPEVFSVEPIVTEIFDLLRPNLPEQTELRLSSKCPNLNVLADSTQIHRVLLNLLQNARQSMTKAGGVLSVQIESFDPDENFLEAHPSVNSRELVKITVSDTGLGIAPDVIENIFEPFFTTRGVGRGTGLGLAIAYGIVQGNHGAITVESEVGMGSRFMVFLPCGASSEVAASHSEPESQAQSGHGEVIVVIDDDQVLLQVTQNLLERLSYTAVPFHDPVDAVAYIQAHSRDVSAILSDLTMPSMSGIEVAQEIKRIAPDLPIILTSGFNQGLDDSQMRSAGIQDFLQKPVTAKLLGATIGRALGRAKEPTKRIS